MSFGGKKQKATVYGELPGIEGAGSQVYDMLTKWLQGLSPGGTSTPGTSLLQGMIPGATGAANLATQRQQEVLSPDWLTSTSPGLAQIIAGMKGRQTTDLGDALRANTMRFASAGHSFSSPMLGKEMRLREESGRGLSEAIGGLEYGDYSAKRAAQLGMIPGAQDRATGLAQGLQGNALQLIQMMMQYAMGGKGQVVPGQSGGGGGFMDIFKTILPILAKKYILGAATGGAGAAL